MNWQAYLAAALCVVGGFIAGALVTVKLFLIMHENALPPNDRSKPKGIPVKRILLLAVPFGLAFVLAGCANLKFEWKASYKTGNLVADLKTVSEE